MNFYRGFSDTEVPRDLLTEAATRDLNHDLSLPGAQQAEAFLQRSERLYFVQPVTVESKSQPDGVEQILVAERLGQKLDSATFHRLHGHRDIAVSCHEDDRDSAVRRRQLPLQVKTASAWQSHVENQTSRAIRWC